MTRIRTALGAVATVATAVVLSACGNSVSTGASATSSSPTTSTAASATGAPATTTGAPAGTPAQNAGNGKVSADLNHQQAPGSEILAVTNKGSQPLKIDGWPELSFLNAADGALAVPVQKVNQPGAATPTTLQPGQTAFAGVKLVLGDKGDASTFVATTTKLTVPGAPTVVVNLIDDNGHAAQYPELDLKSVQVGTFQPAMQGVSPDAW